MSATTDHSAVPIRLPRCSTIRAIDEVNTRERVSMHGRDPAGRCLRRLRLGSHLSLGSALAGGKRVLIIAT